MTALQKKRIFYMRGKGESYARIAATLDISENTVKSFCRRNNLGADYMVDQTVALKDICCNCGRHLTHTPGRNGSASAPINAVWHGGTLIQKR